MIRLTKWVPWYLRALAKNEDRFGLRQAAIDEITRSYGIITEDTILGLFEQNNRDSSIINFSSRKFPSEETLYTALMALPPGFCSDVLDIYEEQGYLLEEQISSIYRIYLRNN